MKALEEGSEDDEESRSISADNSNGRYSSEDSNSDSSDDQSSCDSSEDSSKDSFKIKKKNWKSNKVNSKKVSDSDTGAAETRSITRPGTEDASIVPPPIKRRFSAGTAVQFPAMSSSPSSKKASKKTATPPRTTTPPRAILGLAPVSPPFLTQEQLLTVGMQNLNTSAPKNNDDDDDESMSSGVAPPAVLGSRSNPFICPLDLTHTDPPRDFYPVYVNNMERLNAVRHGVSVSKLICSPDEDLWSAEIPLQAEFPSYYERCILVKGPSLDFFQRHADIYHAKFNPKCSATLNAHEEGAEKTKEKEVYYLLVFAEGIKLDNTHFAGHVTNIVPTLYNRTKFEHGHPLNEFGKDFYVCHVYWEVALKHGGHKKAVTKAKVDKKQLYN